MIIDRLDEECLLFALHSDGTWVSRRHGSVRYGIAASWILEIIREGKVRQVETKLRPRSHNYADDETIDKLLAQIYESPKDKHIIRWLAIFAKQAPECIPLIAKRLKGRGYIDIVELPNGKHRFPMHGDKAREDMRKHLVHVMSDQQERDIAALDMLCILGASGMTEEVFRTGREAAEERIQELIKYDPLLVYMWKCIRTARKWGSAAPVPRYVVPKVSFQEIKRRR